MSHDYKPGDPIEVDVGWYKEDWRHEGRTYVGEWKGRVAYGAPGINAVQTVDSDFVRPYTPPVEIPEGWTLMRSDELEDVHEVYDPRFPSTPWSAFEPIRDRYPVLVVARRRADA